MWICTNLALAFGLSRHTVIRENWGVVRLIMSRIVHVITRFVNGGADENTLLSCNHQVEAGHLVWLFHGADFSPRMIALLDPRVEVRCIAALTREIGVGGDLRASFAIIRLLRAVRPDIVHTHTSKAGIIGRLASLAVPGAKVAHGVHILPFTGVSRLKRLLYLGLEKLAALQTHAFIDVSEGMRDLCLENGLGRAVRHHVIRSGMDIGRFRRAVPAPDLAATLKGGAAGADRKPVAIAYVAVLERRKRHAELVKALAPILAGRAHVHLFLAGEGPERSAIARLIDETALGSQIHLLGFRADAEAVIAASDICVFASEREGLPRSIVQYAIAGKPIVATALPGIELVVRDGVNGHVVEADDFESFAMRLSRLIDDPASRETMGEGSADLDFARWDARVMTGEIESVYRNLLQTPTQRGLRGGQAGANPAPRSDMS